MLARKSTLTFLNSIVGGVLGYVALKAVALYMGAGEYGQLVFATSLVGTITFLADLGINTAHQKRVSEGRDLGDCVATYTTALVALAAGYVVVVLGALALNRLFLGRPFISTTEAAVVLVTLSNAAIVLRRAGQITFTARREIARSETINLSEHLVRVPAWLLFALLYASAQDRQGPIFETLRNVAPGLGEVVVSNGANFLALGLLLATGASAAVSIALLVRHHPWGRFDRGLLKDYATFAAPAAVPTITSSLSRYIDKAALGFFWSASEAGLYYGVQRLLVVTNMVRLSIGAVLFPQISDLHAEGRIEDVRRLLDQSTRYISMVVAPMAFGVIALADPFIRILLSNEWIPAILVLQLLAIQAFVAAVQSPLTSLLYGMDRPREIARIALASTAVSVVGTLVLVPTSLFQVPMAGLRGVGAALAAVAAVIVGTALKIWVAPERPHRRLALRITTHILAAAAMGIVVWTVHTEVFALVRWFHVPLFLGLGAGTYFGLLALVGEFRRKELDFFWAALHPGEMGRYIREEMRRGEE